MNDQEVFKYLKRQLLEALQDYSEQIESATSPAIILSNLYKLDSIKETAQNIFENFAVYLTVKDDIRKLEHGSSDFTSQE